MDSPSNQTTPINPLDLANLTLEIERLNAEMIQQSDQMAAMLNAEQRALHIDATNEFLMN